MDGAKLPNYELDVHAGSEVGGLKELFVFCHGMGGDAQHFIDPMKKAMGSAPHQQVPRTVLYDARGWGNSSGYEEIGFAQYHWRALSLDMLSVAVANGAQPGAPALLGGCSMSSVSALYGAMHCPELVRGVIMYMVPQIWEFRGEKADRLVEKAKHMEDKVDANRKLGAALTDLPPREEVAKRIHCPVLMMNCREDPTHPASGNEALKALLGEWATSIIVDTKAELLKVFQQAIPEWIKGVHAYYSGHARPKKHLTDPSHVWPVFSKAQGGQVLEFFNPSAVPQPVAVESHKKVKGMIFVKPSTIFNDPAFDPQEFQRYSVPVLIVACKDDAGSPVQTAEAIAGTLGPNAKLVVVESKAEIPTALTQHLPDWLEQLPHH